MNAPAPGSVPTFAVFGQPNNGKTTVVSTLAEEDSAEITPIPGTTLRCRVYPVTIDGVEVLRFIDTPGFEEAPAALEWFQANAVKYANPAAAFIDQHERLKRFPRECEILRPLAAGAVALYVIDGSLPLCEVNRMEMELLQLAKNPRAAVINSKEDDTESMESWKPVLNQTFNGYHLFNGQRATFADRIELLDQIKGRFPYWRPQLEKTIGALREDWNSRLSLTAGALCDLLSAVMSLRERVPIGTAADGGENSEQAIIQAQARFREAAQREEEHYRARIRSLFKHHAANWTLPPHSLLEEDLFSDRVWKFFGLSRAQLVLVSMLIFGTAGGYVDAHFLGASWGLGALIGAGSGAVIGFMGATQGISVTAPGLRLGPLRLPDFRAGQYYAEARARAESNLPWILLDRALMYFQLASSWSHGRQERLVTPDLSAPEFAQSATRHWNKDARTLVLRFQKYSQPGANPKKREEARKALSGHLSAVLRKLTEGGRGQGAGDR